jgi:hypothetical protein
LNVFSQVPVEKDFFLTVECVLKDFINFFGRLRAKILNGLLERLPKSSRFLIDGLHFVI